jgi:DNA-binding NtrC family response regulator
VRHEGTILVVDDDTAVAAFALPRPQAAGFLALSAGSPDEALRRIDRDQVDLVLQDMNFSRHTTGEEAWTCCGGSASARPAFPSS